MKKSKKYQEKYKNRKNSFFVLVLSVVLLFFVFEETYCAEINQKINELSNKIIETYNKLEYAQYRNAIAITDFEDKTEKDIGYGISELITTELSKSGKLRIVERKQVSKVLEEQKLGLLGIIDSKTAKEVGNLTGADMILVGSVSKLGNYYHINARLVETETGQILISEETDVEVELLEKTIESFIYVPRKERIGIYLMNNFRYTKNNPIDTTNSSGGYEYSMNLIGVGIKYFIFPQICIDLSYRSLFYKMKFATTNDRDMYMESIKVLSPMMGYILPLSVKTSIGVKGGIACYVFDDNIKSDMGIWADKAGNYNSGVFQVEFEYFIFQRSTLSFSINYENINKFETKSWWRITKQDINPLSYTLAFGIYF